MNSARHATRADVDAITDVFTTAFFNDPIWAPVFPDEAERAEQSAVMWRVYATSALRYPWTFVTPTVEAAAEAREIEARFEQAHLDEPARS